MFSTHNSTLFCFSKYLNKNHGNQHCNILCFPDRYFCYKKNSSWYKIQWFHTRNDMGNDFEVNVLEIDFKCEKCGKSPGQIYALKTHKHSKHVETV